MFVTSGAEVAEWRMAHGLSAAQAAPIVGLSRRTIEGLEACDGKLTQADALRVDAGIALYLANG